MADTRQPFAGIEPAYAHSKPGAPPSEWEPLEVHLRAVSALAERFAGVFGAGDWGRLAGLWHDLGKVQPEFQRHLRGERIQVEHAGIGATLAFNCGSGGVPLALTIAGHHAGLPNLKAQAESRLTPLFQRVARNQAPLAALAGQLPEARPQALPLPPRFPGTPSDRQADLRRHEMWTRMVFSTLIDADRLATEAFYDPARARGRSAYPALGEIFNALSDHLATLSQAGTVNAARASVLKDCLAAARHAQGIFSLTAPTGSGKTLSSMAFALSHALRHSLRRVVVVVPYTSIIEQNAKVYRDAFAAVGAEAVVEHHSGVDVASHEAARPEDELARQLAVENWDAPVVVTTTVQLFESLFSNQPGACRKLHNLARSVIVLDEAQALPVGYLACILDALRDLVEVFGSSIVISTATQPALSKRESLPQGLAPVREIISDPRGLAARLRRVRVHWPPDVRVPTRPEALAEQAGRHPQVLVVVHRRSDAYHLAQLLPAEGRYHLSALMCAAHRLQRLEEIRARLKSKGACRVVSTQLIEAGVDIDFPVVFRALAGLDSLAQAAGRCNREGRPELGDFHVFRADSLPPPGVLRAALEATESMLASRDGHLPLDDPNTFEEFFRLLHHRSALDRKGVQAERAALNFATVADLVQLIEDGYQYPIVVPWDDGAVRLARFESHPDRRTARAIQPFIVQIPRRTAHQLQATGRLRPVDDFLLTTTPGWEGLYSTEFGFIAGLDDDLSPNPLIA